MTTRERQYLPRFEKSVCFGCGLANPIGLGLHFFLDGDAVAAEITLRPEYAGWERIAHGGIISTLLDEAMAYAIVVGVRDFFVTRSMSVRYRRGVPIGEPLRVRGRVTDVLGERERATAAEIEDARGQVLASATGEMVLVDPKRMELASPELLDTMRSLFEAAARLRRA